MTTTWSNGKSNNMPFSSILLAINFNNPFYNNIPILNKYFGSIFEKVIYCGPERSRKYDIITIEGARTYFGYMCLAVGIQKFPNYKGYLFVNDDMIVNWWNMIETPQDKIWYGKEIYNEAGAAMDKPAPCCWHWWTTARALEKCKAAFNSLQASSSQWNGKYFLDIYFENTKGAPLCLRAWSDFMYIPSRLSKVFSHLANEFYRNEVFLEVAVATILSMLDKKENIVNLDGVYLPDLYGDVDFSDGNILSNVYDTTKSFYHPVKLSLRSRALNLFNDIVMKESEKCLARYLGSYNLDPLNSTHLSSNTTFNP